MNWLRLADEFKQLLHELIVEIRALREELRNAKN